MQNAQIKNMMDLYVLGILWSIGSPIEDRYHYFMLVIL